MEAITLKIMKLHEFINKTALIQRKYMQGIATSFALLVLLMPELSAEIYRPNNTPFAEAKSDELLRSRTDSKIAFEAVYVTPEPNKLERVTISESTSRFKAIRTSELLEFDNVADRWIRRTESRMAAYQVIVGFYDGTESERVAEAISSIGAVLVKELPRGYYLLELNANSSDGDVLLDALDKLSEFPGIIRHAGPNRFFSFDTSAAPQYDPSESVPTVDSPSIFFDDQYDFQWGLHNEGGSITVDGTPYNLDADADIDATEAWEKRTDATSGGSNLIVAVVDSGVDYDHEDLDNNMWSNVGWNFIDGNNDPHDDDSRPANAYPYDVGAGHGTHVAGIVGAIGDNTDGVSGVSWDVDIMALKVFEWIPYYYPEIQRIYSHYVAIQIDIAAAIDYAVANGAEVINLSLGFDEVTAIPTSGDLFDALEDAETAGVIVVAAAGNSDHDNDSFPTNLPSSFPFDNIVSVAATEGEDGMTGFTNWGSTSVDIAAPGFAVLSTTPNDDYEYFHGTSQAAPFVSGTLALTWSQFPNEDYETQIRRILDSADTITTGSKNIATEARLNLDRALSPWLRYPPTGNNWYWTPWFGNDSETDDYVNLDYNPWVYNSTFEWMFTTFNQDDTDPDAMWFWTDYLGWVWFTPDDWPYMYSIDFESSLFYDVTNTSQRYFYVFELSQWVSL